MINYRGGDGSTKEQAIIIPGVDAEYNFLQKKYEDFEIESQIFVGEADKKYDVLSIKLPYASEKEIYFDVSNFYGKE